MIEQLLVEDPDFHRSLIEMLSKEWHDKPCVVPTLPAVNMGVIGTLPVLFDGSDNDPEKWSKDYMMPEAFLPPLHLCGEFGLSHSLLEYNSVNSQDVCNSTYMHMYVYSVFELAMCACKPMGKVQIFLKTAFGLGKSVYICVCMHVRLSV